MPASDASGATPVADGRRRLYGRGKGRPLSARQQSLIVELGPRLALPDGPLDPTLLFPQARETRLEIGFGAGDHLCAQAQANPDIGFIGVEFYEEGVAKALARLDDAGAAGLSLEHVRVHQGDGRTVLDRLPEASIAMVYILFPDPWPKTRHHKRRLIQPDVVEALARITRPGGRVRIATDVRSYVDWALRHMRAHDAFSWTARRPGDWRTPPDDHIATRYERKNLGDSPPVFLEFLRR